MEAGTLEIVRTTAELVMPIFCMILGWLLNALFGKFRMIDQDVKKMAESFNNFERDMPLNYIRREDYKDDRRENQKGIDAIFQSLRRIEDKLDEKADKQ
ncbi:MAG: hypothetical protein JWN23_1542 [Rhodocyclales bacterium]|nr:hypothetical protein [Rhodocyclales bacterium]